MENKYLRKRISIFYNDGVDHVSRKEGIVTDWTFKQIELDNKLVIFTNRIVRVEIGGR